MQETERAHADKPVKTNSDSYIRFSSRRGTYNTITFSMVELMPEILRGTQQPPSTGPQVSALYIYCAVWVNKRSGYPCNMLASIHTSTYQR
jgi:hypothetical protein